MYIKPIIFKYNDVFLVMIYALALLHPKDQFHRTMQQHPSHILLKQVFQNNGPEFFVLIKSLDSASSTQSQWNSSCRHGSGMATMA